MNDRLLQSRLRLRSVVQMFCLVGRAVAQGQPFSWWDGHAVMRFKVLLSRANNELEGAMMGW